MTSHVADRESIVLFIEHHLSELPDDELNGLFGTSDRSACSIDVRLADPIPAG